MVLQLCPKYRGSRRNEDDILALSKAGGVLVWGREKGWCQMSVISGAAPRPEDEEESTGGPIGALVIAVPISLLLWGAVMFVLFHFIR